MTVVREVVDVVGLGDSSGYAYAQCVRFGDLVFVAGQTGIDEHYRRVREVVWCHE